MQVLLPSQGWTCSSFHPLAHWTAIPWADRATPPSPPTWLVIIVTVLDIWSTSPVFQVGCASAPVFFFGLMPHCLIDSSRFFSVCLRPSLAFFSFFLTSAVSPAFFCSSNSDNICPATPLRVIFFFYLCSWYFLSLKHQTFLFLLLVIFV